MRFVAAFLVLILTSSPAKADENVDCDRSGDFRVTAIDALIALRDSVDPCLKDEICDTNGDFDETVADALLLLRFAVGQTPELICECTHGDECFGDDEDCVESGFPEGYRCKAGGPLCVECLENTDCPDGQICDGCRFNCIEP